MGACAGAGEMLDAVFITALLITINVALRPVSRWIDRHSPSAMRGAAVYRLMIVCPRAHEQTVGALLVRALASRPLTLRQLRTEQADESDEAILEAVVESVNRSLVEGLVSELRRSPDITDIEWAQANADAVLLE